MIVMGLNDSDARSLYDFLESETSGWAFRVRRELTPVLARWEPDAQPVPGDDLVPFGIFTYIDRAKQGDPCDDGTGCCEWCGKSLSRVGENAADGCRVCLAWLDWYGANHAR